MNVRLLELYVSGREKDILFLHIRDETEQTRLTYHTDTHEISWEENALGIFLKKHETQLRKILHIGGKNNHYNKGFQLRFSLVTDREVSRFNRYETVIALDRRDDEGKIYPVADSETTVRYFAYTDGCFFERLGKGGFAVLIRNAVGKFNLITRQVNLQNSNTIELLAVIVALKSIPATIPARIITDSRYVKKGITEWIIHWKNNDWHTAMGNKVRNIEYWQELDSLIQNRYTEFQWIKGHAGHFENQLCHKYAQQAARKKKDEG